MTEMYIVNNIYDYPIFCGEGYTPISSGVALMPEANLPNGYLRDDIGEEISNKNETYAELTVHYWIWKNSKADVVGVVHYRRYFVNEGLRKWLKDKTFSLKSHLFYYPFQRELDAERYILNMNDIERYLEKYDILVKEYVVEGFTVKELFNKGFGSDFCFKIERVIKEHYYSYLDDLNTLLDSHSHYHCNMFVGKKSVMDQYWLWLFNVLSYLEDIKIDFQPYTDQYDKRYANVAELLFKLWIVHNNVRHCAVDVIKFDRCEKKLEKPFIRRFHNIFTDVYHSLRTRFRRMK